MLQTRIVDAELGGLGAAQVVDHAIRRLHQRLVLQGSFQYQGQTYMLGKLFFVLKSGSQTFTYPSNPGINGNFAAQLDLNGLPPGEYALYAAGGVVDGLDALGSVKPGFNPTGYKITIP